MLGALSLSLLTLLVLALLARSAVAAAPKRRPGIVFAPVSVLAARGDRAPSPNGWRNPEYPREDPFRTEQHLYDGSASSPKLQSLRHSITGASGAMLFFCLVWRMLSLFELVRELEATPVGSLSKSALGTLLALNALGFVASATNFARWKNQLKAILALNIVREWMAALFNIAMIFWRRVDASTYQGALMMNIWWGLMCFSFSRSQWARSPGPPPSVARGQNAR